METYQNGVSEKKSLILATTSPYRLGIFANLGIDFVGEGSNVDEYTADRPSDPIELTSYLAKLKAEAVAKNHTEGIVVGFDTVCFFEGTVFEKPKTREEAFIRLQAMSGKMIRYVTGLHVIDTAKQKVLSDTTTTDMYMRNYSDSEINYYLDHCNEEYKKHAHAMSPEKYYSMSFMEKIVGEPYGVDGTPLSRIMEMLQEMGFNL